MRIKNDFTIEFSLDSHGNKNESRIEKKNDFHL